jgi:hypothetical protein
MQYLSITCILALKCQLPTFGTEIQYLSITIAAEMQYPSITITAKMQYLSITIAAEISTRAHYNSC